MPFRQHRLPDRSASFLVFINDEHDHVIVLVHHQYFFAPSRITKRCYYLRYATSASERDRLDAVGYEHRKDSSLSAGSIPH